MLACVTLEMVDSVVNVGFILLNIVYTVWGWVSPDESSIPIEDLVKKLEFFVQFIKYSDLIFVPARIALMILVKYLCCHSRHSTEIKSTAGA